MKGLPEIFIFGKHTGGAQKKRTSGPLEFLENLIPGKKREEAPGEWLLKSINNALEEMYCARSRFDMAVGDESIELAVYELAAAEIKYRNLIKEAKRAGLVSPVFSKGEEEMEDKCS